MRRHINSIQTGRKLSAAVFSPSLSWYIHTEGGAEKQTRARFVGTNTQHAALNISRIPPRQKLACPPRIIQVPECREKASGAATATNLSSLGTTSSCLARWSLMWCRATWEPFRFSYSGSKRPWPKGRKRHVHQRTASIQCKAKHSSNRWPAFKCRHRPASEYIKCESHDDGCGFNLGPFLMNHGSVGASCTTNWNWYHSGRFRIHVFTAKRRMRNACW